MLRRHRRAGFLPSAWVFPGGRVTEEDGRPHPGVQGSTRPRAHAVAAVRETWEEAGLWLGESPPPPATRLPLQRGAIGLHDLLDTYGSTVVLDRLLPWAWWITPEAEPRRYDTRFFVAMADGEGEPDRVETTEARWVDPRDAIQLGQARFPLAPPTWWTLAELARLGSVGAVLEEAPRRPERPIVPIMRFTERGFRLLLPGHPEHPDPRLGALPVLIELEDDRWRGVHGT